MVLMFNWSIKPSKKRAKVKIRRYYIPNQDFRQNLLPEKFVFIFSDSFQQKSIMDILSNGTSKLTLDPSPSGYSVYEISTILGRDLTHSHIFYKLNRLDIFSTKLNNLEEPEFEDFLDPVV
eukprot:GHVP01007555.1.p1 GENE.GHVP01007555.1~~GHVP01007555.1.p1  ORF type:complete len:121 (+),score=11.02 GHVP01007555.1:152-514(+)